MCLGFLVAQLIFPLKSQVSRVKSSSDFWSRAYPTAPNEQVTAPAAILFKMYPAIGLRRLHQRNGGHLVELAYQFPRLRLEAVDDGLDFQPVAASIDDLNENEVERDGQAVNIIGCRFGVGVCVRLHWFTLIGCCIPTVSDLFCAIN